MMKFIVSAAIIFLCFMKLSMAAPSVQLAPGSCVKAGDSYDLIGEKLVGKNWPHYRNFMKICPIDGVSDEPALFVYTLDINDPNVVPYKNGKPFDIINDAGPPDKFPLPGLIDARHRLVGSLPVQIYSSAPQSIHISFLDWRENFPFRIAFRVIDPTVSAPFSPYCPPPLIWRPSLHNYVEAKGDFFGDCPRQ